MVWLRVSFLSSCQLFPKMTRTWKSCFGIVNANWSKKNQMFLFWDLVAFLLQRFPWYQWLVRVWTVLAMTLVGDSESKADETDRLWHDFRCVLLINEIASEVTVYCRQSLSQSRIQAGTGPLHLTIRYHIKSYWVVTGHMHDWCIQVCCLFVLKSVPGRSELESLSWHSHKRALEKLHWMNGIWIVRFELQSSKLWHSGHWFHWMNGMCMWGSNCEARSCNIWIFGHAILVTESWHTDFIPKYVNMHWMNGIWMLLAQVASTKVQHLGLWSVFWLHGMNGINGYLLKRQAQRCNIWVVATFGYLVMAFWSLVTTKIDM